MSQRPPPLPPGAPGGKRIEPSPPTKPSGTDLMPVRVEDDDTATSLFPRPSAPPTIDLAEVTHPEPEESIEPEEDRFSNTLVEPVYSIRPAGVPLPTGATSTSFDDIETTQVTHDLPDLPVSSAGSAARIVVSPAPPQPPAAPPPLPAGARSRSSMPPPLPKTISAPPPPEPGTPAAEIQQLEVQAKRSPPLEAARLYSRAARLIEGNTRDRSRAIAAYRRVYEIDDGNVPALESLARLSIEIGDWEASAAYRARLAGLATNPRDAARAHVAVGDLLAQDERDLDGARLQYERAATLDPKNEAAWRALLKAAQDDDDDERRLHVLERRAEYEENAVERARLHVQVAKGWAELGQTPEAHAAYEKALAADPTNEAAAAVLVGEYASAERWNLAQPLIDMLAAAAKRGGDPERALQYLRLGGRAARSLGDRQKAVEAALALFDVRPQSQSVREELLEAVYLARDDVGLVTKARPALVQLASGGNLSTTALLTLAELRGVLGEWRATADLLARAVKLETVPERKAQALLARGRLLERELGDLEGAMVAYDEVLHLDPLVAEAMHAIERVCTARNDLGTEEKILRRTLDLLPDGERELRHTVMQRLGRLYREEGQGTQAIDMFRAASRLDPKNAQDRIALEDLFLASDQLEAAVHRAQDEVARAPLVARGYTELYSLLVRQSSYDKAWCVLDVLSDLGALDEEERRSYDDYPPLALKDVPGQLTAGAWRSHLAHPQLDGQLTLILQIIAAGYLRAQVAHVPVASRHAFFGSLFTRDTSRSAGEVVSALKNGAEVLALPPPALYVRRGTEEALGLVLAPGNGVYVCPEAVEAVGSGELPFLIGRRLAELRPELMARAVFPGSNELKTALGLGIALSRGAPFPDARPQFANVGGHLTREEHDLLRGAVADTTQTARLDVRAWAQLVDESATRAGLLLAGRVGLARRGLLKETGLSGDPTTERRVKSLYAFAISDTYTELRGALGIGVNIPTSS